MFLCENITVVNPPRATCIFQWSVVSITFVMFSVSHKANELTLHFLYNRPQTAVSYVAHWTSVSISLVLLRGLCFLCSIPNERKNSKNSYNLPNSAFLSCQNFPHGELSRQNKKHSRKKKVRSSIMFSFVDNGHPFQNVCFV